jgi:hypothetical protein
MAETPKKDTAEKDTAEKSSTPSLEEVVEAIARNTPFSQPADAELVTKWIDAGKE